VPVNTEQTVLLQWGCEGEVCEYCQYVCIN
jgi:hypothetical protein